MIIEKYLPEFKSDLGYKDPIELKRALNKIIQQLLNHDMERLLHLVYRIDVDEQKFKEILTTTPTGHISEAVTNLIWERCLQKQAYRKYYKGNQDS